MCSPTRILKRRLDRLLRKQPKPEEMPTIHLENVIAMLEEDVLIHEHWAVYVIQHPKSELIRVVGDYQWHLDWIEVYENAIYYLRQLQR